MGKDYCISQGPYENTQPLKDFKNSKSKQFAGEFRTSTFYNNASNSDKLGVSERASKATLHTTGDKF